MNLNYIRFALAVAESASFTKAAEKLFTSQPNVSAAISSLESKLEFKIFNRTNRGVTTTSKGDKFLKHAINICREVEEISKITNNACYKTFTIGYMFKHTLLSLAFMQLCQSYENIDKINFTLCQGSFYDIMQNLCHDTIDLGVLFFKREDVNDHLKLLENKDLHASVLLKSRLNIILSKEHPLAKESKFDFAKLYNYPCVNCILDKKNDFVVKSKDQPLFSLGYINKDKLISVDDEEISKLIVLHTNAFYIGPSLHPETMTADQLGTIQLADMEMVLLLVGKSKILKSEESELFSKLLLKQAKKAGWLIHNSITELAHPTFNLDIN